MKASLQRARARFSLSFAWSGVLVAVLGAVGAACNSDELVPDRGTRPGPHIDGGHDGGPEGDAGPDVSWTLADSSATEAASLGDVDDGSPPEATPNTDNETDADQVCTPGLDQTCNDNPAISSLHGHCTPWGTCDCSIGMGINPATGRCL